MPTVALLTDFGHRDACVGAMKGVILSIAAQAQICDITHDVPPQDIAAGAVLLEDAYSYFPSGTIFVAVVDPGVGSARTAVAVQTERFTFIGPDNGLLTLAYNTEFERSPKKCALRALNNPKFHLPQVSATFHGRDIFAPAAAWLARGISFSAIGDPHPQLAPLANWREVLVSEALLEASILRVDHFGNLITNLKQPQFQSWSAAAKSVTVELDYASGLRSVGAILRTYSDVPAGEPLAYFGSSARLEVALAGGNLCEKWGRPRSVRVIRAS